MYVETVYIISVQNARERIGVVGLYGNGIILMVEAVFDIVAIALGGEHKGSDDDIIDV